MRSVFLVTTILLSVSCAGAGDNGWVDLTPEPSGGEAVHLRGTVRHLEIEGGLYVIRTSEGTSYNPTNLPESFQVDGMKVEADARRRDDMMSIGMAGTLVDLLRIRKVADGGE